MIAVAATAALHQLPLRIPVQDPRPNPSSRPLTGYACAVTVTSSSRGPSWAKLMQRPLARLSTLDEPNGVGRAKSIQRANGYISASRPSSACNRHSLGRQIWPAWRWRCRRWGRYSCLSRSVRSGMRCSNKGLTIIITCTSVNGD